MDKALVIYSFKVFDTVFRHSFFFVSEGETSAVKLGKFFHNDFERGQTDEYKVNADDVGDLLMITLMKSTGGFYSDWFVNKVAIAKNNVVYTFPCFRWVIKELVVFEGKGIRSNLSTCFLPLR